MHDAFRRLPLRQHLHQLAPAQLLLRGDGWQQRNASATHRGFRQNDEVVARQLRLELNLQLFALVIAQRPAHFVLRV
ncbi:hypothetical protein D3C78_1514490 [compost metagenome]